MTPTACRLIMNEALLAINTALSLKQAQACFEHSSDSDKAYCSRSAWEVDGLCRLQILGTPSQRAEGGVTAYLNAKRLPRRRRCSGSYRLPPPPATILPLHLLPPRPVHAQLNGFGPFLTASSHSDTVGMKHVRPFCTHKP